MMKNRKLINCLIGAFVGALILTFLPISALADDPDTSGWPTECYCDQHPNAMHFWWTGATYGYNDSGDTCCEGVCFATGNTGEYTFCYAGSGEQGAALDILDLPGSERSWCYYDMDEDSWHVCSCNNHSIITPASASHPIITPASASTADMTSMHVHKFVKGVIYEATTNADGLEGIYCESCGFVMESSPISAFAFTLDKYAQQKIDAAKPGQTIVLEFGEFNSFPKSFMQKIAGKVNSGVSFEFRYKVNHQLTKIKIPAGATVDTNLDWYGPATMEQLYGVFSK